MMKICSNCKIEKEMNGINFEPRKNTKDGFRNQCRDCRNLSKRNLYTPSENVKRWSKQEKEILINYYPYISGKDIHENFLPNRSINQINEHAVRVLKLTKDSSYTKGWSKESLEYVKSNYSNPLISIETMSNHIGKSTDTVVAMANKMGLFREGNWTKDEIEIMEKYYPNLSNKDLQKKFLPNKKTSDITRYANQSLKLNKSDEFRKQTLINTAIKNLYTVNNKKEPTKPERYIIEVLQKLNVEFIFQEFKKYYWVDFYLPNENLIIEVQGDYFHCNPLLSLNYKVLDKNKIIAKDKRKNSYFKNKGMNVLYLWESDINKTTDKCTTLIQKYINNKGQLNNYHSFNYSLIDGELKENNDDVVIGY
jgi:very-short-patch-repair endonuclease